MKLTKFPLNTCKETPNDAKIVSHQLMIRAGLIYKLSSGLYTWSPLGLIVLKKVENIVRDHMNKAGAYELLMPMVQPAALWQESHRWDEYGAELLRLKDRHNNDFCLGPTHEEVITDYVRSTVKSYKNLPLNLYQIQTKFRDEIRPRFGVMRAREFIMKDAYSFHLDDECLQKTYDKMYQTYCDIFSEIGLLYRAVIADSGNIGGNKSHEFHVIADSGEDEIVFCPNSDYAANIEKATAAAQPENTTRQQPLKTEKISTPRQKTIDEVANFLKVNPKNCIKTLIVETNDEKNPLIALVLRGDHTMNEIKVISSNPQIKDPLIMADEKQIFEKIGCHIGSIGPINLNIPIIADIDAACLDNFICGANEDDFHFINVNWQDVKNYTTADLRNVVDGDISPDGKGKLKIVRGIEVGHIFQLGTKYSDKLKTNVLNQTGKPQTLTMGCYGIGISRIVAAAVEQSYDENGIIWPKNISPFQIAITAINIKKSSLVKETSEKIYQQLIEKNIEVLFDDRGVRPGVSFADMELIGVEHLLVIGDRSLENDEIEYRNRNTYENKNIKITELTAFIADLKLTGI
ncbi:MAG: proline--tRNA ligase [Gammaproteobacteria bacterium]|nr:MAG: proline--tRNA ligase [Gammaproteobacteria bacterium]